MGDTSCVRAPFFRPVGREPQQRAACDHFALAIGGRAAAPGIKELVNYTLNMVGGGSGGLIDNSSSAKSFHGDQEIVAEKYFLCARDQEPSNGLGTYQWVNFTARGHAPAWQCLAPSRPPAGPPAASSRGRHRVLEYESEPRQCHQHLGPTVSTVRAPTARGNRHHDADSLFARSWRIGPTWEPVL